MKITKYAPELKPVKYRNGNDGRVILVGRINTRFEVLSIDNDGVMYHHLADGRCNLDRKTESPWDLIL